MALLLPGGRRGVRRFGAALRDEVASAHEHEPQYRAHKRDDRADQEDVVHGVGDWGTARGAGGGRLGEPAVDDLLVVRRDLEVLDGVDALVVAAAGAVDRGAGRLTDLSSCRHQHRQLDLMQGLVAHLV